MLTSLRDVERLIEELNDPLVSQHSFLRRRVISTLGDLGDARAIEPLVELLSHDDPKSRSLAAYSLAAIGDRAALPALVRALEDSHRPVREWAAVGLGRMGEPQALEPLVEALRDERWSVRRSATIALAKIGDPRAIGPLRAARAKAVLWRRTPFTEALATFEGQAGASSDSAE